MTSAQIAEFLGQAVLGWVFVVVVVEVELGRPLTDWHGPRPWFAHELPPARVVTQRRRVTQRDDTQRNAILRRRRHA